MAEPDPPQSEIPKVPPKEAIAFFRAKGLAKSFAWQDLLHAQHDYFFTVAKMMNVSLLEDVRAVLAEGLEAGTSPQQMARDLKTLVKDRGWWGKKKQRDPLTGEMKLVQLGSNRRIRTIVNANLRTSYASGRWERQQRTKQLLPILVYKSLLVGEYRRPEHKAWHNTALYIDDPWWDEHYGPCGWGCQCKTVSMTVKQAERRGLKVGEPGQFFGTYKWRNKRTGEVLTIERGLDPGWDYHPGKAPLAGLAPDPLHGYSGEGISTASALPSPVSDVVERFLNAFSVPVGEQLRGKVFVDAAGWPLPVSGRWLRGLSDVAQAQAARAANAVSDPDRISLVWVKGADGRAILFRRYAGHGFTVDVSAVGWRFRRGVSATPSGLVVWPRAG